MSKLKVAVAVGALVAATTASTVVAQDPVDVDDDAAVQILAAGGQVAPKTEAPAWVRPAGPNPYLALVPDPTTVDVIGWQRYVETRSDQRAAQRRVAVPASPILVDEDEPDGDARFERHPRHRPAGRRVRHARPARTPGCGSSARCRRSPSTSVPIEPDEEDDGSIRWPATPGSAPAATASRPRARSATVRTAAPGGTGDFDFYAVDAGAGEQVTVDIDTPTGRSTRWSCSTTPTGDLVAFNDDARRACDSRLSHRVAVAARYYVLVTGLPRPSSDPYDPASGDGRRERGPVRRHDHGRPRRHDFYAVQLRKGDVLGASVTAARRGSASSTPTAGGARLGQDASFIYPPQSPLPGGGNAVTEHVADEDGLALRRRSAPAPATTTSRSRPTGRRWRATPIQTLFLDFDGARVNTGVWGGPGVRHAEPAAGVPRSRGGCATRDHERR